MIGEAIQSGKADVTARHAYDAGVQAWMAGGFRKGDPMTPSTVPALTKADEGKFLRFNKQTAELGSVFLQNSDDADGEKTRETRSVYWPIDETTQQPKWPSPHPQRLLQISSVEEALDGLITMIAPGHSVPHTIRNPEHGLARDHGIFGIYEAMKPPLARQTSN